MRAAIQGDRYQVIGHPIRHSLSPKIHQTFAEQTQEAVTYTRADVDPKAFAAYVRRFFSLGGKGLNITVPHKVAAFQLADELDQAGRGAEAVNTLYYRHGKLVGTNTDGVGFVRDLTQRHRFSVAGNRVLMLGAGGAARGLMLPLLACQPSVLAISNRTTAAAQDLVKRFQPHAEGCHLQIAEAGALQQPFDLVINATAIGLAGATVEWPVGAIQQAFCYDLSYAGGAAFARWAARSGASQSEDGLGMLVEQAAESFQIWRNKMPLTEPAYQELRAELVAT